VQKEYLHFVAILLTYFCWVEGAWAEAVVVVEITKTTERGGGESVVFELKQY
jgi:hypothetical protein